MKSSEMLARHLMLPVFGLHVFRMDFLNRVKSKSRRGRGVALVHFSFEKFIYVLLDILNNDNLISVYPVRCNMACVTYHLFSV